MGALVCLVSVRDTKASERGGGGPAITEVNKRCTKAETQPEVPKGMTREAEKGPHMTGNKEFVGDLGRSGEGERPIAVCGMGCGDRVRGFSSSWGREGARVVRVLKTLLHELWFSWILKMRAWSLSECEGGGSQGRLKTY